MYSKDIEFEWNEAKSQANLEKHHISFPEAEALWDDEYAVELPSGFAEEDRWLVIGRIGDLHWTAIVRRRAGRVRIISVRRARQTEIAIYE